MSPDPREVRWPFASLLATVTACEAALTTGLSQFVGEAALDNALNDYDIAYSHCMRRWAPAALFTADLGPWDGSVTNSPQGICLAATWQGFDAGRAGAPVTDSPYREGEASVDTLARRSWLRGVFMGLRVPGSSQSWDGTHVRELLEGPGSVAAGLPDIGTAPDAAPR